MATRDNVELVASCPICDGRDFRPLSAPRRRIGSEVFDAVGERIGLCRCAPCDFTFVNPRPAGELLGSFYASDAYGCHEANDSDDTQQKMDHLLDRVLAVLPNARRILDFGCGGGLLLRRARQRGFEAIGYDVGERALCTCAEQGLEVVDRLDALKPGEFDAIVLHHVFEHLDSPGDALSGLARLLKRAGSVFIEVPNATSLRARLSLPILSRYLRFDERYRAFPIHLSYFSPKSLGRLLERHGFVVKGVATYGLGIDELIVNAKSSGEAYGAAALAKYRHGLARPAREFVKRRLFAAGLGENLLVVAEPRVAA